LDGDRIELKINAFINKQIINAASIRREKLKRVVENQYKKISGFY
jgi:hypothetical protein